MTSNTDQDLPQGKRSFSGDSNNPSKRLKRVQSVDVLTERELNPRVVEMNRVSEQYREQCIANKKEITDVVNSLQKLVKEADRNIIDFKQTLENNTMSQLSIGAESSFLKKLIQTIIKNLDVWDNKLNEMEASRSTFFADFENEFKIPKTDTVINESIEDQTSDSTIFEVNDDCQSVNSNDSQKTVLNDIVLEEIDISFPNLDAMDKFSQYGNTLTFTKPDVHSDSSNAGSDISYVFDISNSAPTFNDEYKHPEDCICEEFDSKESIEIFNSDAPVPLSEFPDVLNSDPPQTKNVDESSDVTALEELLQLKDTNLIVEPDSEILDKTNELNLNSDILNDKNVAAPVNSERLEDGTHLIVEPDLDISYKCKEDILVQKVNVVPVEERTQEMKLELLRNLGLTLKMEVESFVDDDEEDVVKINEALRILKTTKDELMERSTTLSGSSGTDSYTSEESDDDVDLEKTRYHFSASDDENAGIGKIVNCLPSLPHTSDSDVEDDCLVTSAFQSYELKCCKVVLERIDALRITSNDSQKTTCNDEYNEINRLTNLATLNRDKDVTVSNSEDRVRPNRAKLSTKHEEEDEEDYTDDSIECIYTNGITEPDPFPMELDKVELSPSSNLEYDDIDDDLDVDDAHQKKTKTNKFNDSDKENKQNGSTINKELTAEEIEKGKWKNDVLLRGFIERLLTDSDDSEDEAKRITKKQEKSNSKCYASGDILDLESPPNSNKIIIGSDSDDSEIEFVTETEKRPRKIKKSIEEVSSDFETDNGSDEDTVTPKKGRKNIRPILSDETLEEATKEAVFVEHKRKERLNEKQKEMDSYLSQSSESSDFVLDVDENTKKPIVVVHSKLRNRLKDHQIKGVRFMWESCYESVKRLKTDEGSGCILAHCMGLGKTFQVVTLLHALFTHAVTNTKHVLVVCPLSIVLNWKNEFKWGLKGLNDKEEINIFNISERFRTFEQRLECVLRWRQKGGVLIMGYEAFQSLTRFEKNEKLKPYEERITEALINPGPDLVVLDEGHLLKNGKNDRTQSLMRIRTKRRIVLTGTPMQNNLKEYYYMIQFVKPNLLGSYHEYTNRFVNPIINGQFDDSTEEDIKKMKMRSHVLYKLLSATIQRFEVSELMNYLPQRYDYAIFIELHPIQIKLYKHYLEIQNKFSRPNIFSNYHILQYISNHPFLLVLTNKRKQTKNTKEIDVISLDTDPDKLEADVSVDWWKSLYSKEQLMSIECGPKFNIMLTIIKESEKVGDKVLIFSNTLIELDAVEYYLKQNQTATSKWIPKEDYYRMDGSVSPETRLQLCYSFSNEINKRARVFLISHKVGGLGLNLAAANRVILLDVNWNPALDNQSVFRSYRFGQTKQCYVYRLVSQGTMEEVVYDRQVTKSAVARRVVDEKQINRLYKKEDLEDMYRVKFDLYKEKKTPHILPEDPVLKRVLSFHQEISKYHEHNALLENMPEEQLDEDQRKLAWDDYNKEQETKSIEQQKKKIPVLNGGATVTVPNTANFAISNAINSSIVTTSNTAAQPDNSEKDVVSFLPSDLRWTKTNSTIDAVAAALENKFNTAFQDMKNAKISQLKMTGNPVPTSATTTINNAAIKPPLRTNINEEVQQKSTKQNLVITPKIVNVSGAVPKLNSKVATETSINNSAAKPLLTSVISRQLNQKNSDQIKSNNQVVIPKIVSVSGALPVSNNKVTLVTKPPLRTNIASEELQEQFSDWNKNTNATIPRIVSVTGAVSKPNNKVSSTTTAPISLTNTITLANKPKTNSSTAQLNSYLISNSVGAINKNNANKRQGSISSLFRNPHFGSTLPSTTNLAGNNVKMDTRNLGYSLPPDLVPSSSNAPGLSTIQNKIMALNRNIIKMTRPRRPHVFKNAFAKDTATSSITKSPAIRQNNQNQEVVEINDFENIKDQQDALTALQRNSNITLSSIQTQSDNNNKSIKKTGKAAANNLPAVSITHQTTFNNNNEVIELD